MTAADFFAVEDQQDCIFQQALTDLQQSCVTAKPLPVTVVTQLESLALERYFPAVVVLFSLFRETAVHSAGINLNIGLTKDDNRAYGYVIEWMLADDQADRISYQAYFEQLLRQLVAVPSHTHFPHLAKCRSAASQLKRRFAKEQKVIPMQSRLDRLLDELSVPASNRHEQLSMVGSC